MKKSFFASAFLALGILVVTATCCPLVFAKIEEQSKPLHQQIEKQLSSLDGVKDAKIFLYEDCALVALRTQNVSNKTQTEKIQQEIKDFFAKKYPQYQNVTITCSMKIFVAIEQINYMIDTGKTDIDDIWHKLPRPAPNPDHAPQKEE